MATVTTHDQDIARDLTVALIAAHVTKERNVSSLADEIAAAYVTFAKAVAKTKDTESS